MAAGPSTPGPESLAPPSDCPRLCRRHHFRLSPAASEAAATQDTILPGWTWNEFSMFGLALGACQKLDSVRIHHATERCVAKQAECALQQESPGAPESEASSSIAEMGATGCPVTECPRYQSMASCTAMHSSIMPVPRPAVLHGEDEHVAVPDVVWGLYSTESRPERCPAPSFSKTADVEPLPPGLPHSKNTARQRRVKTHRMVGAQAAGCLGVYVVRVVVRLIEQLPFEVGYRPRPVRLRRAALPPDKHKSEVHIHSCLLPI